MKKVMKVVGSLPKKRCAECGELINEKSESYFMECEHCLREKPE